MNLSDTIYGRQTIAPLINDKAVVFLESTRQVIIKNCSFE